MPGTVLSILQALFQIILKWLHEVGTIIILIFRWGSEASEV